MACLRRDLRDARPHKTSADDTDNCVVRKRDLSSRCVRFNHDASFFPAASRVVARGIAVTTPGAHNQQVASWGSYAYVLGPMMVLAVIGFLTLVLRWAFGRGSSVVESDSQPGSPDQYGLLDAVAAPGNFIEAGVLRQRLEAEGIRATVAMTNDGPRVMVWPPDKRRASKILARH
jgi:hypothetical protein